MAKTNISIQDVLTFLDGLTRELNLKRGETKAFYFVEGPTNKYRIYLQRSKNLNRIDTTLPRYQADGTEFPGTIQLSAPNGSITCHLELSLENLDFHVRRLLDSTVEQHSSKRPRPFSTPKVAARRPQPIETAQDDSDVEHEQAGIIKKQEFQDRMRTIHEGARRGRINKYLDNPQQYHCYSTADAEALADGKVTVEELAEAANSKSTSDLHAIVSESGLHLINS